MFHAPLGVGRSALLSKVFLHTGMSAVFLEFPVPAWVFSTRNSFFYHLVMHFIFYHGISNTERLSLPCSISKLPRRGETKQEGVSFSLPALIRKVRTLPPGGTKSSEGDPGNSFYNHF
jgi:hypothetical protein